jgi:hypothetical protein
MALNICLLTTHRLVTDVTRCGRFFVSPDLTDNVQTYGIHQYSGTNVMHFLFN